MQADFKYTIDIVEFINCNSRYSIIPQVGVRISQSDALLASCNKLNSNFVFKLDINSNIISKSCQIYLWTYKTTYYKYGTSVTGQYRFNFF